MTAQIPPKSLSEPPLDHTYSFIYEDGKFDYFIQQPAYDGCKLMLGGGYYEDPEPTTYNDAQVCEISQEYLKQQLPKVFRWEEEEDPSARVHTRWSGIMGFSEDGCPWVGSCLKTSVAETDNSFVPGILGKVQHSFEYAECRNAQCLALCGIYSVYGSWERASEVFS